MTDHLTAEDAARLLAEWERWGPDSTPSGADARRLAAALADSVPKAEHEAVIDDLIGSYQCEKVVVERDAALAEVTRLSAKVTMYRAKVTRLREALSLLFKADDSYQAHVAVCDRDPCGTCAAALHVLDDASDLARQALAEGSDVLPTQRDH